MLAKQRLQLTLLTSAYHWLRWLLRLQGLNAVVSSQMMSVCRALSLMHCRLL